MVRILADPMFDDTIPFPFSGMCPEDIEWTVIKNDDVVEVVKTVERMMYLARSGPEDVRILLSSTRYDVGTYLRGKV